MFGLDEDWMGRLDLRESFHIGEGLGWVALVKFIVLVIVVAALVYAFARHPTPGFYPAFLTPWGIFFCIWYLGGSLLLTSCKTSDNEPLETASLLVKFTWMVFSLAAVMELCIAVLYWGFVYDPIQDYPISLHNLNVHGICMAITLLQGFLVDRVPVRIKHFVLPFFVGCVYSVWLVIQNAVIKYNPMENDPDDDALYDVIKWRTNASGAAIMIAAVLFGALPVLTIFVWLASLPGRRYLEVMEGGETEDGVLGDDKAIGRQVEQDRQDESVYW